MKVTYATWVLNSLLTNTSSGVSAIHPLNNCRQTDCSEKP